MSEFKVVASISSSGSLLSLYKKKRIFFLFYKYELVGSGFRSEDEIQNYIKNNYQRSSEFYLDAEGNRTRCWG